MARPRKGMSETFYDGIGRPATALIDRFMRYVSPEPNSGCWLWTAGTGRGGYARLLGSDGKTKYAHRVAYMLLRGAIPHGLFLDHLCRVRCCVNPDHLEPVTCAENIRRGETGRLQAVRTHCPQGHEYTDANIYRHAGQRHCRECRRESVRKYDAKRGGSHGTTKKR